MSCPSSEFFHERAKRFDGGGCQRRNVVGETATRGDHYGTGETCDANAYRARPNAPRTGCHPSVRTASSSDRVARSCISVSRPENHDHRFQHTFLSAPFFFTSCAAAFRFVLFARLKSRAPYPISFFGRVGFFGFFRPRKIPALYSFCGLTRHTRIKYSVLREAQPRNARDLRVRALALRRCCAFSAAGADTTSRASPVARHERPHRVEEDRGRTHDAVGVRRGRDGAGPAQHASR